MSNFGNTIWNNFSSGISAIGNWGRQIGAGIRDTFSYPLRTQTKITMQGLNSIGQGLANFGQGIGQGWNNFALGVTSNDIFKGIQRFSSGFLSGLNKNFTDFAFKDLWSNAIYQPKLSPIRTGLSSLQILGVGVTAIGLFQPYSTIGPNVSIDKAQTMVAIKGLKALAVTGFTRAGFVGGFAAGVLAGPYATVVSPITGGVGAAAAGFMADKFTGWVERKIYNWAGWDQQ